MIEYNSFQFDTNQSGIGLYANGDDVVTLKHNNITLKNLSSHSHIYNGSDSTVTGTDNYFTGCAGSCDAPIDTSGPNTAGITTASAAIHSTVAGVAGCVGSLCNRDEN